MSGERPSGAAGKVESAAQCLIMAGGLSTHFKQEMPMSSENVVFTPDPDADSISSDVAGFGGILVSTQVPTRADGSLELGDITLQSECTLQALKVALEKAGSSMDRVMHLTIYLTDMADRAAFNEVYKRFFAKPWPVRAAVGVAALAVEGMRVEVTAMAAKG
jgi:enamine deaminase RidA (YjgF/YER057c/UK114 family)